MRCRPSLAPGVGTVAATIRQSHEIPPWVGGISAGVGGMSAGMGRISAGVGGSFAAVGLALLAVGAHRRLP